MVGTGSKKHPGANTNQGHLTIFYGKKYYCTLLNLNKHIALSKIIVNVNNDKNKISGKPKTTTMAKQGQSIW